MTAKLQQDFLLLFQCIIDFGAEVLRDFTTEKMKAKFNTDNFKKFLGNTKHHFYHQITNKNPICCECPSNGCSIRKTKNMDRKIFDKFYTYDKRVRSPPGHQLANGSQICICRFVENNTVLTKLDLSDLHFLLRSLSFLSFSEEILIKELMDIRGKVCHAVDTKTFSQIELTNLWTTVMNAICKLYPSDPKFLKRSIELTKSSVLSDEKVLDLMEKVQKISTDCSEIKPVVLECKEIIDTLQSQKKDQNILLERIATRSEKNASRLERIESLLMGDITTKDNSSQTNITFHEPLKDVASDEAFAVKQGDKHIECEANCPTLDENKALERLQNNTEVNCPKEFKIESVEKHCILLKLSSQPEVFESKEILYSAIMSLVQKISDAGDLDKSVENIMDIKITFTSPLTVDERSMVLSMLETHGNINAEYTAETTDKDEGIGDIDNNEMYYSDNHDHNGHDGNKSMLIKEEFTHKLENPDCTFKKVDTENIPMDLPHVDLKTEAKEETKLLDSLYICEKVKVEAIDGQDGIKYFSLS